MYYMRVLMDADAIVKLAVASAKEEYLASVEGFIAPAAAREASLPGVPSRPADAVQVEENIRSRRLKLAGGGRLQKESPLRTDVDGDHDMLGWAESPGFELVVTDDRRLRRLLVGRAHNPVGLCGSIAILTGRGILPKERGLAILARLRGRVREADRLAAIRDVETNR